MKRLFQILIGLFFRVRETPNYRQNTTVILIGADCMSVDGRLKANNL
ncbi:hypothetical protein [Aureibaculum conchae]